ncbi:MAG: Zn-ribbon domain-containing OB-fold protein [Sporichthyaceae bacterium]
MSTPAGPRFGTEGPTADLADLPFWEGLRAGELRVQHCACDAWIFPARRMCPACHATDPAFEAVALEGVVYSWTRTRQAFAPGAVDHLPYVVLLVELPQAGGRRILGLRVGGDVLDDPVIGTRVRGEIEPAPDADGWPLLRWAAA